MAALGTFTGLTALTESVVETLNNFVQGYPFPQTVASQVAWIIDRPRGGTHQLLRFDSHTYTNVSAKTETDTYGDKSYALSEASFNVSFIGARIPISREVQADSGIEAVQAIVAEATRALLDKIDVDVLAAITSSSSTTGADTDDASASTLLSALSAARANNLPPGRIAVVMKRISAFDLLSDLAQSGASMLPATVQNLDATGTLMGSWMGVDIHASENVAANGAGWSNIITVPGDGNSCLALVMARRPGVEFDADPNRETDYAVVSARYAAGLSGRPHAEWVTA